MLCFKLCDYDYQTYIVWRKTYIANLETEKGKLDANLRNVKRNYSEVTKQSKSVFRSTKSQRVRQKWVDDIMLDSYFDALSGNNKDKDVLFLGPSATQLLKFSSDTSMDLISLESYQESKFAFICVNNSSDLTKGDGGSHWSLLFFEKDSNMTYHFDS